MLTSKSKSGGVCRAPGRENGIVLLVALIMLIVMTLGALTLVRTVDNANIIAGNLAFQQGATNSADTGVEQAITWLQNNKPGATLFTSVAAQGYAATRQDPAANQSWDAFWLAVLANQAVTIDPNNPGVILPYAPGNWRPNAAGNTVSYSIQRLCAQPLAPTSSGAGCSIPQATLSTEGSSKGAGVVALQYGDQVYYRITARSQGPRNTVSYVQVIVAI